jgi:adenosylhomocysteine nucleosidase
MQQEINAINNLLIHKKEYTYVGIKYYKGNIPAIDNIELISTESGIGKVNSAATTALLIQHLDPDYIINVGSAGSLQRILRTGDVVIADRLTYHDVDVTAFGYQLGQLPNMPTYYYTDEILVNILQVHHFPFRTIVGEIISGDTFIASNNAKIKISSCFSDALAVDMEAASIAQICYRLKKPFVVIKSISDIANTEATESFKQFLLTAAQNSALIVYEIVEALTKKMK